MVDVRMPDGTIIKNVPKGTPKQQLLDVWAKASQPQVSARNPTGDPGVASQFGVPQAPAPGEIPKFTSFPGSLSETPPTKPGESSFWGAFGRQALMRYLQNNINAVDVIAKNNPVEMVSNRLLGPSADTPPPSAQDVLAMGDVAAKTVAAPFTGNAPPSYLQAHAQQQAADLRNQMTAPMGSALGSAAGDAATLASFRSPFADVRAALPEMYAGKVIGGLKGADNVGARIAGKLLSTGPARVLARAAGRGIEGGLEGATLSIINSEDPTRLATFNAGAQAGGTIALSLASKKGVLGLATTALGVATLAQLAKDVTPGGKNYILPSIETGFSAVSHDLLIGAMAALAGAGRLKSVFGEKLPIVTDALSTLQRGSVLSVAHDIMGSGKEGDTGDTRILPVLTKLGEDPEFFSQRERRALGRALYSNGKVSLSKTLDTLSKNKDFADKLAQLK